MAIALLQAPLAGLRGKYGGMIFSANKNGPYVKQFAVPVAKRTVLQSVYRARFSTISILWNSLDAGQIADWKAFAAAPPEDDYNSLDVLILLSGFEWHNRINMRRLQAGQSYEADCPANVSVTPPTSFDITAYDFDYPAGVDLFSYTDGDFDTDYAVLSVASVPSLNRSVVTTGYYSIWCGAVEQSTWTRINEELATSFGWLRVGHSLFGSLRRQNVDGIRSTALQVISPILVEP